jgi:release factor glutamine methyltransferase
MHLKSLLNKSILELRKAGIDTPDLDTKVLLVAAMAREDAFVYSHPDFLVTNAQYAKFRRYIRRRKCGEPIAYILVHKEFYGYNFLVNKNVLVPRPESEWLVDAGISFLQNYESRIMNNGKHNINILDMGTGSGCLAISISKELQTKNYQLPTKIFAVDSSKRAIVVAKKNSKLLKPVHSILFLNSNLFENLRVKSKKFNLMIANLPYVPPRIKKVKSPIDFEPQDAIFAGNNGTEIIKLFLSESKYHIEKDGLILLELDPRNANDLLKYASKIYPEAKINLHKDLADHNRYLSITIKK